MKYLHSIIKSFIFCCFICVNFCSVAQEMQSAQTITFEVDVQKKDRTYETYLGMVWI